MTPEKTPLPASIAIDQIFTMIEFYNPTWWNETLKGLVERYGPEQVFSNLHASAGDFNNFSLQQLEEAREVIWSSELRERLPGKFLAVYLSGRIDERTQIQKIIK